LFVGLASVAGASLGFHDREHVAACVVEAIVGDSVPWLRLIAIDWDLSEHARRRVPPNGRRRIRKSASARLAASQAA
jgi:hypothetical protein